MVVVNTKTIDFKLAYLKILGRGAGFVCLQFVLYWLITFFTDQKQCKMGLLQQPSHTSELEDSCISVACI